MCMSRCRTACRTGRPDDPGCCPTSRSFLALSTSSPFWHSHRTGLMGYRQALYAELPRFGLPDLFRDEAEGYNAYVKALWRAGVIEDSSYVWWAIRPSLKHPTLGAASAGFLHAALPTRWRSRASTAASRATSSSIPR